ncbi:MAG TPA: NUDIX domain-containing protein [Actinomycetota bacterium]|nr:NUDIX domain-containing protein [Actinomycetota bacterium]
MRRPGGGHRRGATCATSSTGSSWEGTRIHKTVHFYLMDAREEDPAGRDREMEEVRWFPLSEAPSVAGFDSEREVLAAAAEALTGA